MCVMIICDDVEILRWEGMMLSDQEYVCVGKSMLVEP